LKAQSIPFGRKNRYPSFDPRNAFTKTAFSPGLCACRISEAKSFGSACTIFRFDLPAAFNRVVSTQSKRVLRSSDTDAAVDASEPPIAPGFGEASGIVKTRGSEEGGGPEFLEGVMFVFFGKKM
jgi:hypothetical protein